VLDRGHRACFGRGEVVAQGAHAPAVGMQTLPESLKGAIFVDCPKG